MKKIIIIDDDTEDIEIMKESVAALGPDYECETFLGACEALDYLRNGASIPDLIVIDINMPRMSGQECLDDIRKIEKLRPVLVAITSSAMAPKESLSSFTKSGAIFFQKPSTYDEMNAIFRNLVETIRNPSHNEDRSVKCKNLSKLD